MSSGKVKCTCGWSWNKSDSSKKDMYICHECGRDNSNNMKNGGWLDNYNDSEVSLPEGYVGEGYDTSGRDYSPAWGGQFQDGGAIYVSSENDPRYKSYADSLYNYNLGNRLKSVVKSIPSLVEVKKGSPYDKNLQKTLMKSKNRGLVDNTKNPNSKSIDPRVQALMKEYQKKGNKGIKPIRYNSFVDNPDNVTKDIITARGFTDLIGLTEARPSGYNIPEWKKPKQKVVVDSKTKQNPKPEAQPNKKLNKDPKKEVVQPDLPRVEAINLPSMQNQLVNFPNQEIDVRTPAQAPTSFDISSQRYNMQGPSDYYNYNEEDVDYETALRAQQAAEKYNTDIEKRYGPQNEYRTEKSRQEAARRLEKLRQDVKVRPNYQMGGSVYPVNYVPEAQMGASIPGAVGFSYARTQSPAPSNGPYAKKTKASAQDGKVIKDDRGQWDHPGEVTEINSNEITMKPDPLTGKKLTRPLLGISDTGDVKIMKPGKDYKFKGTKVTEYPIAQEGATLKGATLKPGTPEYKKAYDENRVAYYDKDSDTYINQELDPVEVQGKVKEKGFWDKYILKILEENKGASPLEAMFGVPLSAITSVPQIAATYAFTGEVQRPSEAMDIENPYLAMGTDFVLDPANLVGAGVLTKEQALARLANTKNLYSKGINALETTLPKVKTFAKGAASDIKFTADQIGHFNNHIKTTRPYVDQSLAHINDVRRIPEHMNTVVTRDDLIHQLNYLQDDLRATYQSASGYRATPEQIDRAVGEWSRSIVDKIGGGESLSSVNPAMSDPAHIQNLYNNILDNLPNAKEIEKFGVSALKTARREQIFNPSTDIEKIKTFAKSIGKKSDDLSEITIAPKEQETINAVRELGKYRNMINSDMKGALSHKKTLQNLNDLILKLDDDVVETIVGVPKAELLNRYKSMVPLDVREGVKDIISNPISTNELRSIPAPYTAIDPAIQKLNTGYSDSSLFSKLGKRYYEISSPYNIETITDFPESMISFARTDKYLKPKYDWENNFIGYEDDVFTTGNTSGQLRDALKKVEAAPKGRNFVGSGSLSTDSFPLTIDSGMLMTKKGIVEPKFSGELRPLNPMGATNQLPNLSLKEINFKIQELEKLSGKKIPRAKLVDGEYKVPEIYFTRLREGGSINSADENSLVKLNQLTNFTNYNTKQPGGWLDKY